MLDFTEEINIRVPQHEPATEELEYLRRHRVGRLVTVPPVGVPSAVPCCFAVIERDGAPVIVSVLDRKPKSVPVRQLQRVRNIQANPRVSLLVDDYSEDWTQLGFVLVHGIAQVLDGGSEAAREAIAVLREKYPQYRGMDLDEAPVIEIGRLRVSSWSAAGALDGRPDDLASVLRGRRSVRSFLPDPVPAEVVRGAIEAAGWAPSPHGRQPWRFAVVERPERRAGLADAMAATWDEQLRLDGQDEEIVRIRLEKSKQRLIEAPVLVIPCLFLANLDVYPDADRQAAEELMAIQSLGSAVQNFLLTIYASGFDAGWMCAPLFCPDVVRAYLGLDERFTPHALLPVGKAAKEPVRRPRRPVDELIVEWD
jgi:coenzyme F420-0:L-glutamate ligase/coenzyme F420-1:gamma-L-glutamate ligase